MKLIYQWKSSESKSLWQWILLNSILLFIIFVQRTTNPDSLTLWTIVKDFITLNVAIFALTKASFVPNRIKIYFTESDKDHSSGSNTGTKFDFFLKSFGSTPTYLAINNLHADIDIIQKIRDEQEDLRRDEVEIEPHLILKDGSSLTELRALSLLPQSFFSIVLEAHYQISSGPYIISGNIYLLFSYIEPSGEAKEKGLTLPFNTTFGS